jgi:hypothetical protein
MREMAWQARMRDDDSMEDPRISLNARHENAMEKGFNDMRSPKSQHMVARLKRLEEDAMRARNSVSNGNDHATDLKNVKLTWTHVCGQIITLLDLRHRQATTENAISSGKQADQLFTQSQALFVFTLMTIIFVCALSGHVK